MYIDKAIKFIKGLKPMTKEKKWKGNYLLKRLRRNQSIYPSKIPCIDYDISLTWQKSKEEF